MGAARASRPRPAPSERIGRVVAALARSEILTNFLRDFRELAGISVEFRDTENWPPSRAGEPCKNPFCALLVESGGICTACLLVQREDQKPIETQSVQCLAGLCECGVPVMLDGEAIAFLVIGPSLPHPPSKRGLEKALRHLRQRGIVFDIRELEAGYLASPVISLDKQSVIVRLLTTFAAHLAIRVQEMMMSPAENEAPAITRAREFIAKHQAEKLSLTAVAKAAHMNPVYFCRAFKKATGFGFSEYVTRLRIERAKWLLRDRSMRINEVAFAVGFGSTAQFNRAFKRLVGHSPSRFREV